MIGFSVDQARGMFFDSRAVTDPAERATRRVLSRFGAFVRTRAKRSIRKGTKRTPSSPPGRPPRSHAQGLLRRFIFFGYDKADQSVVVGPAKLNGTRSGTALEALEYGGPTTVGKGRRRRRVNVQARPFMGPAFEAELERSMPDLWKDSVR